MAAASLRKVLVIVGSTGAGKTKLSIDLAKAVGGEIINSDAMQMYRGLDIATAKITEQEKDGVPHHLLDVVDPSGRCDVLDFKRQALCAIDDVLARGKVPIIVGGTMYYTQSILWKAQVLDDVPTRADAPVIPDDATPEEIYARLREVDPAMASRWHVNQTRRVRRSLEVFYQTGVRHSELIARQQASQRSSETLFDACAFWIHCNKPTLAERLATRVDTMMASGLVDEIRRLREQIQHHPPRYAAPSPDDKEESEQDDDGDDDTGETAMDYTVGILQAIGYKEFAPYLEALEAQQLHAQDDSTQKKTDAELETLLQSCIEQLNVATRQYARRQLSWIRNRFVPRNIPVYQVDSSDVAQWDDRVATPAVEIARAFVQGEAIDATKYTALQDAEPHKYTLLSQEEKYQEKFCAICGDRKFVGAAQWAMHLKSKGHKYHVRRIEIEKERPQWEQLREAKRAATHDPSAAATTTTADAAELTPTEAAREDGAT